jgi:hypothetical protein
MPEVFGESSQTLVKPMDTAMSARSIFNRSGFRIRRGSHRPKMLWEELQKRSRNIEKIDVFRKWKT